MSDTYSPEHNLIFLLHNGTFEEKQKYVAKLTENRNDRFCAAVLDEFEKTKAFLKNKHGMQCWTVNSVDRHFINAYVVCLIVYGYNPHYRTTTTETEFCIDTTELRTVAKL